jgi:hypothetical protein
MAAFIRSLTDARRVSAPFVVVRTPDQFQSRSDCFQAALDIKSDKIPTVPLLLAWDSARGITAPVNGQAKVLTDLFTAAGLKQAVTIDPTEAVMFVSGVHDVPVLDTNGRAVLDEQRKPKVQQVPNTPHGTICALHNAQRVWETASVAQALANARDDFKRTFRMFLSLVPMGIKPPDEIRQDCIVLDVPLPDAEQLFGIVKRTIDGAGVQVDAPHLDRATNGVRGLGAFVAETACAMALRKSGVAFDALLDQRIAAIEQVDGVSVYRGGETFADVVGNDGIKRVASRLKTAKNPIRCIAVFDEFEKTMGGSQAEGGDNTGIKQGMNGHLLTWQQNKRVRGSICFGHPGTGKSLFGKALANELGCVCLMIDLNRALNSLVGASEKNIRAITDLIDALAGEGGAFIIATCNSMNVLTTEMRRRFNRGLFFFDLPDAQQREAAWQFYCKRFGLPVKQARPHDDGWTPAEIAVCCEQAYDYGVSLIDAADNVVPVALSQPEVIEQRRKDAHNRLLDANTGLTYRMPGSVTGPADPVSAHIGRAIAAMPES